MHRFVSSTQAVTHTARGFSLVELLVYIAILAVVSVAGVNTLLNFHGVLTSYQLQQTLSRSANTVDSRILYTIRNASSIDTVMSVLHARQGTLAIASTTGETTFTVNTNHALTVTTPGGTAALTPAGVTVDSFYVYTYTNTHTTMARVVYTLSASNGTATTTATYAIGGVLRGTYD